MIECLLFKYCSPVSSQKLDYLLDHKVMVISPVKNQSPMTSQCRKLINKLTTSYIQDQKASKLITSCKYLYYMINNDASHSNC